jgi:Flp pilus assembly protein TadD/S1-C subfamily serine protease
LKALKGGESAERSDLVPPLLRGVRGDRRLTGLAAEVDRIAAEITVRIEGKNGNGSGVIVAQDGTTYYVLTATHMVSGEGNYQVVTPDGKRYPVDNDTMTKFSGIDLAVLPFTSEETYSVATLAHYNLKPDERRWVFLSGWPGLTSGQPLRRELTPGWVFSQPRGSLNVKDSFSLIDGYELVYTNLSQAGMSGGPVLDTEGRVIGIHAAAEEVPLSQGHNMYEISLGYSLGVPVKTFVGLASAAGIQRNWLTVEIEPAPELSEKENIMQLIASVLTVEEPSEPAGYQDWVNYGNQLWRVGLNDKAVAAFDKAIEINSDFYHAWYVRGLALKDEAKYEAAIASFEKATEIQPLLYEAWRQRGETLALLGDYSSALESINQAIKQSPQDFILYWLRGNWLYELGDYSKAIEAYSEALKLKLHPFAYVNRGVVYAQLEKFNQAIADFNRGIEFHSHLAAAYNNRGLPVKS